MPIESSISVAVTTCNRPKYLKECLISIFGQTLQPSEVIISEDGNDQETSHTIQYWKAKYKDEIRIIHVQNSPPLGQLANRQQAIKLTTGEYVAMLDDDDLWEDRFLESTFVALKSHAESGFCSSNHYFINDEGEKLMELSLRFSEYCDRSNMDSGAYGDVFLRTIRNNANVFSLQMTLFRRSVLEKIGFFQLFGGLVPDYALMLTLGAQRYQAYFLKEYLGSCRIHQEQQTTKRLENVKSKVECLQTIYRKYNKLIPMHELNYLKQKYRIAIIERSISLAHANKRVEAIKNMKNLSEVGVSRVPIKRWLVLAALIAGLKKKSS